MSLAASLPAVVVYVGRNGIAQGIDLDGVRLPGVAKVTLEYPATGPCSVVVEIRSADVTIESGA
jgi:hypothetical protein